MKEADITEKSDLHQELVFYKGFSPAKSNTDGQTSTGAKSIPTLERQAKQRTVAYRIKGQLF